MREKLVLLVEHENTILTVQQFLCLTFPSFGDFFLPFVSAFDARLQDVSFLFCDKFMSVGKLGDKLKKISISLYFSSRSMTYTKKECRTRCSAWVNLLL